MRTATVQLVTYQPDGIVIPSRHELTRAFLPGFAAPDFEKIGAFRVRNDELNSLRGQNDPTDRFAVALVERNGDLASVRVGKSETVAAFCCFDFTIQLRAEPSRQKHRGRSESGREIDSRTFNCFEVMMRRGMIEKLCDRETEFVDPSPIQIA